MLMFSKITESREPLLCFLYKPLWLWLCSVVVARRMKSLALCRGRSQLPTFHLQMLTFSRPLLLDLLTYVSSSGCFQTRLCSYVTMLLSLTVKYCVEFIQVCFFYFGFNVPSIVFCIYCLSQVLLICIL